MFTATVTNGGATPAYQWKINGFNVPPNNAILTYIPNNGDVITCVVTSSLMCVSGNPAGSNSITMAVSSSLPATNNIFASANPFCAGSLITYSAFSANGGTNPAYQWRVNGNVQGSNSTSFSWSPADGDYITCMMTSLLWCATPNPVTSSPIIMSVDKTITAGVSIVASDNSACQGSQIGR